MIELIVAILEFVVLLGAAFGISTFFIKRDLPASRLEFLVFRITLGLGIIAYLTFIAAALGRLHPLFFALLLLAGNLAGIADIKRLFRDLRGTPLKPRFRVSLPGILVVVFLLFVLLNLFYSLFPPTFYDSMLYHLAVPNYYIMNGGLVPWAENFNSNLPLNVEMLFLFSLLGKAVLIPKLLSFLGGLGIAALLFSWAKKNGTSNLFLLPVLLFYSIPQVGFLSSSAKSDVLGMLFLFAGVRMFFYYLEKNGQTRLLILSGLFWGMALGSKYIFGFYLVAFFLGLLLFAPLAFKRKIFVIFIISLLVLLCLAPWFVKNALFTGNPLYPYLSNLFPGTSWSADQAASFSSTIKRGGGHDFWAYLWYPVEIFIRPYSYGMTAVLGILFLLFLPFLFYPGKDVRGRVLIVTGVSAFILLMFFSWVPRYFLPSFLLLTLPMAAGAHRAMARTGLIKKLVPLVLVLLLAGNLVLQVKLQEEYSNGLAYVKARLTGKLGTETRYLHILPYYRAAEYINSHLTATDKVAFLGEDRTFYLDKKFFASSFNDKNILLDLLAENPRKEDFFAGLKDSGITHILFNPRGLERFGRMSPVYRLEPALKKRLLDFLSGLPVLYKDAAYILYAIPTS